MMILTFNAFVSKITHVTFNSFQLLKVVNLTRKTHPIFFETLMIVARGQVLGKIILDRLQARKEEHNH